MIDLPFGDQSGPCSLTSLRVRFRRWEPSALITKMSPLLLVSAAKTIRPRGPFAAPSRKPVVKTTSPMLVPSTATALRSVDLRTPVNLRSTAVHLLWIFDLPGQVLGPGVESVWRRASRYRQQPRNLDESINVPWNALVKCCAQRMLVDRAAATGSVAGEVYFRLGHGGAATTSRNRLRRVLNPTSATSRSGWHRRPRFVSPTAESGRCPIARLERSECSGRGRRRRRRSRGVSS